MHVPDTAEQHELTTSHTHTLGNYSARNDIIVQKQQALQPFQKCVHTRGAELSGVTKLIHLFLKPPLTQKSRYRACMHAHTHMHTHNVHTHAHT